MTTAVASALFVLALLLGLALYLTPSIIAIRRQARATATVIAIDVLAGWTLIGWVTAFGLAFRRDKQASEPKHFALGCGVLVAVGVVYEVFNLLWLHIPAP
jgi:hypothetical protein